MSDKVIVLARHATHAEVGRVLSGRSEIALDAAGRAEAVALASSLDGTELTSLHTSPRRRARETAAPVAERRGLEMIEVPALDEIDFGAFTGRGFDALEDDAAWRRWNGERHTARCPDGETMAEAIDRAADYLRSLPPIACPALCVTHCDIVRGLVARARGEKFDAIYAIGCDPASRTTLAVAPDGAMRVVSVNQPPA